MCVLGNVYKFISPEILSRIRNRSQAEVDLIAAAFDAKCAAPDRTRPVMIPKLVERDSGQSKSRRLRSEVEKVSNTSFPGTSLRSEAAADNERIEFEKKWKVEGVVSSRVKKKLDQCKPTLSCKYPNGVDYETLFDELTEIFWDRKAPERRGKRKQNSEKTLKDRLKARKENTRYNPQAVKDKVWARDEGRCTFVGTSGKRCNSTYNLQFDHHPVPFARGGPNSVDNLRLLCAMHNRYTAQEVYGEKHMKMFSVRRE